VTSVTPSSQPGSSGPFDSVWLNKVAVLLRDLIIANVALAFGNISVLGVKPFDFLTQWGHDLQQKASDAYTGQQTANSKVDGVAQVFGMGSGAGAGNGFLGTLNVTTIAQNFINTILKPQNLLATLTGSGVLPDSQKPQIVQQLIDNAQDIVGGLGQGSSSGSDISSWFLSLFGINQRGTNAQSVNTVQDSQIGSLLSGGAGTFDTMDGASATSLPSARWEQTYFGSGGGTSGLSGSGTCTWKTSGSSDRGVLNRYKVKPDGTDAKMSTDTQLVQLTLSGNLPLSTIADDPAIRIQGRMDSTRLNYIEARMNYGQAEIGIVVGGTYTRLGAQQSISNPTSGNWALKLGTVNSTREFVLLQNNVTIMSRTDSGATSVIGASNRYAGFSQVAGVQYLGGIIFLQMAPPDVDSWGASDRLAAL
jgi:hypothetical protein